MSSNERRARMTFLLAWIHLERSETPAAMIALARVADLYPRTPTAHKATIILRQLEGLPAD